MMKHASDAILGDLAKLNPDHRAQIREVAGSNTTSTTILGANRPAPVRDWVRKIGPHREVTRPDPKAPPTSGSTKPSHTWPAPTTHGAFSSGTARRGKLGTMPSREGP
jgi:hypothetical protein